MSLLRVLCLVAAAFPLMAADSHQDVAADSVKLLSRTAEVLAACQNEQGVQTALPKLRKLSDETAQLVRRQSQLAEPTVQDYMAAQDQASEFLRLKKQIQEHLQRMEKAGLINKELRDILHLAPQR